MTSLSVAEINAVRDLLLMRADHENAMKTLDRTLEQENAQLQTKSNSTET